MSHVQKLVHPIVGAYFDGEVATPGCAQACLDATTVKDYFEQNAAGAHVTQKPKNGVSI